MSTLSTSHAYSQGLTKPEAAAEASEEPKKEQIVSGHSVKEVAPDNDTTMFLTAGDHPVSNSSALSNSNTGAPEKGTTMKAKKTKSSHEGPNHTYNFSNAYFKEELGEDYEDDTVKQEQLKQQLKQQVEQQVERLIDLIKQDDDPDTPKLVRLDLLRLDLLNR